MFGPYYSRRHSPFLLYFVLGIGCGRGSVRRSLEVETRCLYSQSFLFINTIVTYLKNNNNNNNKSEKSIKSPFAGTISGEVRSPVSANFLKNRGRNGLSKLGIGRSTNVSFFRWLKCLGIFRNGSACVFVYLIFFFFFGAGVANV